MSALWAKLLPDQNVKIIIATSVVTTVAVLSLKSLFSPAASGKKIIASPRDTQLPSLSKQEQDALPYPPDAFSGARYVETYSFIIFPGRQDISERFEQFLKLRSSLPKGRISSFKPDAEAMLIYTEM